MSEMTNSTDLELVRRQGELLVLQNDVDEEKAAQLLQVTKDMQKQVEATFGDGIKSAYQNHKNLVAQRKRYLEPLEKIEETIKSKIVDYEVRLNRETYEDALKVRKEVERLENERRQEAAKYMNEAEAAIFNSMPMPIIEWAKHKPPEGISIRETYDVEVDLEKLVEGIKSGKIPMEAIQPNLAFMRKAASSNPMISWPGVRVVLKHVVTVKGEKNETCN